MGTYRLDQGTDDVNENVISGDNSGEVYNSYKNVADQPNVQSHHEPIVYEELPTPKVNERLSYYRVQLHT